MRFRIAALACVALVACGGDPGTGPETKVPGSIQLDRSSLTLAEGAMVRLAPSVTDTRGQPMTDAKVTWSVLDPAVASVDVDGRVTGEQPGITRVVAISGTVSASAEVVVQPLNESPTVMGMLDHLEQYIPFALQNMRDILPRNPNSTSWIEEKIALLQSPGLRGEIIHDRRWVEGSVESSGGRTVPIAAVFPLASMRAEAVQSVHVIATALPILEGFMAAPFVTSDVSIFQGFVVGSSGGGGAMFMEDRATYEQRTPSTRLPYDAILVHELGHSYVGSESLTQFLELYLYNVARTGSTDVATWQFTRSWTPGLSSNEGVHALLDVYQLIGHDAMARAYRAVHPLHPPYGQPLSSEVIQRFVDESPAAVKEQVAAKLAMVRF
jgi:hypothetical protein